jgi:hypothetical protein
MSAPQIIHGYVHAPFFIFVRQRGALSDDELLARLKLVGYRSRDYIDQRDGWVIGLWMTNDAEWTHIMDNSLYELYHMQGIREQLAELGAEYDVFTCFVGDADFTYSFEYYAHGKLVRQHVVDCEQPDTYVVAKDFGEPLPIEAHVEDEVDDLARMLRIASSLGIETDPEKLRFRFLSTPEQDDRARRDD